MFTQVYNFSLIVLTVKTIIHRQGMTRLDSSRHDQDCIPSEINLGLATTVCLDYIKLSNQCAVF